MFLFIYSLILACGQQKDREDIEGTERCEPNCDSAAIEEEEKLFVLFGGQRHSQSCPTIRIAPSETTCRCGPAYSSNRRQDHKISAQPGGIGRLH